MAVRIFQRTFKHLLYKFKHFLCWFEVFCSVQSQQHVQIPFQGDPLQSEQAVNAAHGAACKCSVHVNQATLAKKLPSIMTETPYHQDLSVCV